MFVRTVLGDIEPAAMGVTYAREHLVIVGGKPVEISPDFLLADVDRMSAELSDAGEAGLRTAVDAMPADCGRDPLMLAELSRRSDVHLVAAAGLHHQKFYGPSYSSLRAREDESTTRRSGGATARTARSTSSRRLSRTGGPVR